MQLTKRLIRTKSSHINDIILYQTLFSCQKHMSNVKVYDSFLSIGHITTAQASPRHLFAESGSLLFLDSIPPGLNWYLASGIAACHLSLFFIINQKILWICCISYEPNTELSERITSTTNLWQWHLFPLYPAPNFPVSALFKYFDIAIKIFTSDAPPAALESVWKYWSQSNLH